MKKNQNDSNEGEAGAKMINVKSAQKRFTQEFWKILAKSDTE